MRLLPGYEGEVRQGDLMDARYVEQLTHGVDVICHAAAWTSLWAHAREERRLFRDPTIGLIDAAVEARVERFLFSSTVAVAGPSPVLDDAPGKRPGFWPHLNVTVDIEEHMRQRAGHGTLMVNMRLGHYVGARYNKGFLSLFLPRLETRMAPWVNRGRARLPLTDGRDLANAFILAAKAPGLADFASFNICGPSFPTTREVIDFLHEEFDVPRPFFSVPLWGAYAFGWLMEKLARILPGDPFLTRAMVFLGEDRFAPNDLASERLGYAPTIDWKDALRYQFADMQRRGHRRVALVDKPGVSYPKFPKTESRFQ